jgi:pilus assembly protein Flp/PilA
VDLEAL